MTRTPTLTALATVLFIAAPATAQELIGPGGAAPPSTPPPTAAPTQTTPAATAPGGDDDISGLELGVRLALQAPGGKLSALTSSYGITSDQNTPLSDFVGSGFDLVLDVGQRVSRTFYYGLQLSYAPSLSAGGVDPGTSIHDLRVGADIMVHPRVHSIPDAIDPYFGFGVNYDSLTITPAGGGTSVSVYGMEFANIQLGVDYLVTPALSTGLFFSSSFAMYFGADQADTQNAELHEWFTFGLRGAYRL
jgi:hypothetical protein